MRRALLITRRGDDAVNPVCDHLRARGVEPVPLLTDAFPGEVRLTSTGDRLDLRTAAGAWSFGPDDVLWYRRTNPAADLAAMLPPDERGREVYAAIQTLNHLIAAFPGFVLDPPDRAARAANKSWQHRVAEAHGLTVPDTLLTSVPAAAASFDAAAGAVITKLVAGTAVGADGMPTRLVDDGVRAGLDGLRLCPQLFQPLIPKHHELRVTVIGQRVSVARLDTGEIAGAEIDWRLTNRTTSSAWRAGALPDDQTHALLSLLDDAGLQYGAADFIVTPDGAHVFLEVNPWGEFAWLEVLPPHHPHSAWIADVLADAPGARR